VTGANSEYLRKEQQVTRTAPRVSVQANDNLNNEGNHQFDLYTGSEESDSGDEGTGIEVGVQHDEYVKQMTGGGYFQGELSARVELKDQINKKLFAKVKFITNEHQMESGGMVAKIVLRDLNIPENQKVVYWLTHRAFITKTHRTKRNNICMTLKDAYMSKCPT
jgi:hypothetical protein